MEFDPDRFVDDRLQKYIIGNPFVFLPFNAGPRICLGQQVFIHLYAYFVTSVTADGVFSSRITKRRSF